MSSSCSTGGGPSYCGRPAPGTWDLTDELNAFERKDRRAHGIDEKASMIMKGRKESRQERKERVKTEEEMFDTDAFPTSLEMFEASLFEVIDGDNKKWSFGDLIKGQKTIVVFIRHWYCPLCSDYVHSIVEQVHPDELERAGVKLIIIGNGAPAVIHSYQGKAFQCPFPIFTDPTLELYRALGMTRQTGDGGKEDEKGEYIKHSALGGGLFVASNIKKMGVKGVTLQPGHFTQLGGEFVLGPGRNVSYVHRMSNTRGHNPIKVALGYAGVLNPTGRRNRRGNVSLGLDLEAAGAPSSSTTMNGVAGGSGSAWKQQRDGELDRMRAWREERRKGKLFREAHEKQAETIPEVDLGSDGERGEEDEEDEGRTTPNGRKSARRSSSGRHLLEPLNNLAISTNGGDDSGDGFSEPTTPKSTMSRHLPLSPEHEGPRSTSPLPTFEFPQPPAHLPNFLPSPSTASSHSEHSQKSMFRFPSPGPEAGNSRASSPSGPNLLDPITLSIHFSKGSTPKLLSHSRGNSGSSLRSHTSNPSAASASNGGGGGFAWGKRAGSPHHSVNSDGPSHHSSAGDDIELRSRPGAIGGPSSFAFHRGRSHSPVGADGWRAPESLVGRAEVQVDSSSPNAF